MTDYIKKVKLISKKYDSLLEEYEQRIGISNIIQLLKPINEHFVNECHGRIIRKARKKYRSNFPIRKRPHICLRQIHGPYKKKRNR